MTKIGDLVQKAGIYTQPGVIVKKQDDGTVLVDTEPNSLHKFHRYANTTGLTEKEKETFNSVLDKIYTKTSDTDKINDIQQEIDRLKVDPQNKNVVQYLRNQQSHLIRQSKELPSTYSWDASTIRT